MLVVDTCCMRTCFRYVCAALEVSIYKGKILRRGREFELIPFRQYVTLNRLVLTSIYNAKAEGCTPHRKLHLNYNNNNYYFLLRRFLSLTTMYGNNPFAQGGWPNPENPLSINNGTWGTMLLDGPAYGALPTAPDTQNAYLRFYFTDFNPNILNCTIVGPRNTIYYKVIPGPPGVTLVQKPDYSSILFIEWRASPIIDIRDIVPQQLVRQWFTAGAKPGLVFP